MSEPTVDFPETTSDQWKDRTRDGARNRCGDRDRDTEKDRNGDKGKGEDWKKRSGESKQGTRGYKRGIQSHPSAWVYRFRSRYHDELIIFQEALSQNCRLL